MPIIAQLLSMLWRCFFCTLLPLFCRCNFSNGKFFNFVQMQDRLLFLQRHFVTNCKSNATICQCFTCFTAVAPTISQGCSVVEAQFCATFPIENLPLRKYFNQRVQLIESRVIVCAFQTFVAKCATQQVQRCLGTTKVSQKSFNFAHVFFR